jgi:hypothetical protein
MSVPAGVWLAGRNVRACSCSWHMMMLQTLTSLSFSRIRNSNAPAVRAETPVCVGVWGFFFFLWVCARAHFLVISGMLIHTKTFNK